MSENKLKAVTVICVALVVITCIIGCVIGYVAHPDKTACLIDASDWEKCKGV